MLQLCLRARAYLLQACSDTCRLCSLSMSSAKVECVLLVIAGQSAHFVIRDQLHPTLLPKHIVVSCRAPTLCVPVHARRPSTPPTPAQPRRIEECSIVAAAGPVLDRLSSSRRPRLAIAGQSSVHSESSCDKHDRVAATADRWTLCLAEEERLGETQPPPLAGHARTLAAC